MLIVLTRALDLSHVREDLVIALAPAADLFNHPSPSTISQAFAENTIAGACVQNAKFTKVDVSHPDDSPADTHEPATWLAIKSPRDLDLQEGEQIFNWYANAGWGAQNPHDWAAGERKFLYQYGFIPWG